MATFGSILAVSSAMIRMHHHFIILLLSLILTACGNIPQPYEPAQRAAQNRSDASTHNSGTVQFRFIDVGQGDATLITTPKGKQILIDGGASDMGRERVLPIVTEAGSGLELIITSHFDADHIGGIPEVIKGPDEEINTEDDIVPVQGVLDRGEVDLIDTADLSNYFIITPSHRYSLDASSEFVVDGVQFTILGQNGRFKDGTSIDIDPENENAHSISLLITYGGISYLTSGDLPGPNFENRYEPYDLEGHIPYLIDTVDILHVSHHGSHNSSNADFINSIRPKLAVISVGKNDYGHPHPTVINNLLEAGADIYLTEGDWIEDKTDINIVNGDICLESNGENISIKSCNI